MSPTHSRRGFFASLAAVLLAGCGQGPAGTDDSGDTPTTSTPTAAPTDDSTPTARSRDLPADCPTSQDLGVEWPERLDPATVESFVEAYEQVYYREVVVDYEDSRLSSYELGGQVSSRPSRVDGGYVVEYSGGGGVYQATLLLEATTSEPPADADVVPVSDIEDSRLLDLVTGAAETGEAEDHVTDTGEPVRRYVDLLASLSEDFDPLPGRGTSDTLYVDVEGTTVKLTAQATNFHGDYWWTARYYVDEHVVRRTTEEGVDPQNGTLLECRTGE